jgi:hypothetical protein
MRADIPAFAGAFHSHPRLSVSIRGSNFRAGMRGLKAEREATKFNPSMKRKYPWTGMLAPVCGLAGLAAWADTVQPLPTPFPEVRYQQMSARSPFAVATASSAATAAPTPGFAAQLYVDGVAHVAQTDYVAIKSRDPDNKSVIFLGVGESTGDGMKVDRVQWSDEMGKSTVDVSKAGEKATLIFDEQQIVKNVTAANAPEAPVALIEDNSGDARFARVEARRQLVAKRAAALRLRQQMQFRGQ